MAVESREIFLGRQPIFGRDRQLFAYELLFRSGARDGTTTIDGPADIPTLISSMIGELGIAVSLGRYRGFIDVDAAALASESIELLPVDQVALTLAAEIEITPAVVHRSRALKDMGYQLALDHHVALAPQSKPLLEFVDIIKVDIKQFQNGQLDSHVAALKKGTVRLLAEKIETQTEANRCLALGFDYFRGAFLARPAEFSNRKLNPSELGLIKLLGLVLDDADGHEIEDALKHEPALAINLLKLCRSAAIGLRGKDISLRQAITVLGRKQLQRWLQLALYASGSNDKSSGYLLTQAATRGRLMENIAERIGKNSGLIDAAYITGVLSLLPELFGVQIEQIIVTLNLGDDVRLALTERTGMLGDLLSLAEAADRGDMTSYVRLAGKLPGISDSIANSCLTEAFAWANSVTAEM